MKLRLAYLTGQYPRATDTFIQREVEALRALGHHVQTFSVRKPPEAENVGPETKAAKETTIYLLPPRGLIKAHFVQLFSSPRKYLAALALAWKHCPPGVRSMGRQMAYFAEAAMLARSMKKLSLQHLHNHFADSSCSVAVIAATMGGFTFSFTMHGPAEFFDAKSWWIDEKIRRALFVNCISYFCRSQALIFAPVNSWSKLRIVHCGVDPNLFERRVPRTWHLVAFCRAARSRKGVNDPAPGSFSLGWNYARDRGRWTRSKDAGRVGTRAEHFRSY